jgi:L-lysine 2,3-aminomutase
LFDFGVLPYYLHKLDKVQGAVHFEVSNDQVVLLQSQLKEALSGYLVPKFVKEVSGERSKQAIVKCK